jgi:hypothetical protein
MKYAVLWAIAALSAMPAAADTTYQVKISNPVTPDKPICTVDVYAVFDDELYAMAGADFQVLASIDPGGFNFSNNLLEGPGTRNGTLSPTGDSVTNIIAGQLEQLPLEPHLNFDNPVHIWRGRWTTSDFTPRTIALRTVTLAFEVYIDSRFKAVSYTGQLEETFAFFPVGCYADCDASGQLDLFDFLCFTNGVNADDATSDCDNNGTYDLFDFLCFVNAFNEGC